MARWFFAGSVEKAAIHMQSVRGTVCLLCTMLSNKVVDLEVACISVRVALWSEHPACVRM